jgi:hypothetical protein
MNERVTRFALGANMGLSRHDCRTCGSEELHKGGACIHCNTVFHNPVRQLSKTPAQRYKDGLQIKRRRA